MQAVGMHVFAGGFTQGVRRVIPVRCQYERHNLGRETVEQRLKIPVLPFDDADLSDVALLYGNPRCSGFSNISSNCSERGHGSCARQNQDILELCEAGTRARVPVIIWESVQQAYTTFQFRPPLPKCYRVAHVLFYVHMLGNCQLRARYFFVAYTDNLRFNIEPPPPVGLTLRDVIGGLEQHVGRARKLYGKESYDTHDYNRWTDDETAVAPHLDEGECLNLFARRHEEELAGISTKLSDAWLFRNSVMPFGIMGLRRLRYDAPCPAVSSGSGRWVHPTQPRGLTIRELCNIMGWEVSPVGRVPINQIGKGIVPAAGKWIARAAMHALTNHWGIDDFDISARWPDTIIKSTPERDKVIDLRNWRMPHAKIQHCH